MLVPPVAQGGTGSARPMVDSSTRVQQPSAPGTTSLWPLAPAQSNQAPSQQSQATPPLAATPAPAHSQGVSRYGLYSLFPGGGGGSYVAATPTTPGPSPARAYHATTHKVSESVFSAAVGVGVGGYTWGAPTPPPGSPYSPVPVTQLELLAKNLASLAPPGQQPLSLQGVGVNVGSLHHAQHTQHTQHTLNIAGLHHLHHGGLHQSTFSPQLSLVTGGAPTLTINSFSSPNSTGNVVPSTGVLLQEYQSSSGSTTNCPSSSSCVPTSSTTSVSTMVMQGATASNVATVPKKREAFLPSQGQPVKLENKTRQPCICKSSTGKTKVVHSDVGCSRTLPVASSWNGQTSSCINGSNSTSLVKREPLTTVPCQVAEVSTSLHATTTAVKIEPLPAKSENGIVVSNAGPGTTGIPVGIAVARQRLQHQETSTTSSMRNVSLSHHTSHHSYHHFQPDNLGSTTAMTVGGATLVHCGSGGDERSAHLAIPSNALPPSLNAALSSTLNSTLNSTLGNIGATAAAAAAAASASTWPPTLWQYPTPAMPMEPVGFPQMGVGLQGGLQLVRDPTTGHLLLIHAAEQMQQAVVWPNYPGHNGSNVAPPPLLLPPPPPSLQLLSDIGGARLVLTENKRKQQSSLPIVKIEADCSSSPTTIITSAESTKALQTVTSMTGTLVPDTPLVTTLHYYPHAPALVQISQAEPAHCRSQRNEFISKATSPVSCLTPPPEVTTIQAIEPPESTPIGVQDASNQTDSTEAEDELPIVDPIIKQEQNYSPCQMQSTMNFEIAQSSEKMSNLAVRLGNENLNSVPGTLGKVDKSESGVVINGTECAKYQVINAEGNNRSVNSVDRTIEHVVNCHNGESEEKHPSIPEIRASPKIIEITEENCDSFHENLEFFTRRRDPVTHFRKSIVEDARKTQDIVESVSDVSRTPEHISELLKVPENISKTSDLPQQGSQCASCESCGKSRDIWSHNEQTNNNENHSQLTIKSFDMPSIDCDDQIEQIVVKQEKDEERVLGDCLYSQKNNLDKSKYHEVAQKRHYPTEKYHPGIENVVEKLKKNAAAAMQDIQKNDESESQTIPRRIENSPRRFENGLKKLILRSCENEQQALALQQRLGNRDADVTNVDKYSGGKYLQKSDKNSLSPAKSITGRAYFLNNNDSSNNNNNNTSPIKKREENKVPKPEKIIGSDHYKGEESKLDSLNSIGTISPKKEIVISRANNLDKSYRIPDTELDTKENLIEMELLKCNKMVGCPTKQKPLVDLSGLELLSNSIEQLEHRKPDSQNPGQNQDVDDFSKKSKPLSGQSENNNNDVDSPLGLLCALAEQRFMEEVADNDVTKKSINYENSEDVSHASRLLMNLGKTSSVLDKKRNRLEKRKFSFEDCGNAKRLKKDYTVEESSPKNTPCYYEKPNGRNYDNQITDDPVLRMKERTPRNIDFTERNPKSIEEKEVNEREESVIQREFKPNHLFRQEQLETAETLTNGKNYVYDKSTQHVNYSKKYEYFLHAGRRAPRKHEEEYTDSENENMASEVGKIRDLQEKIDKPNNLDELNGINDLHLDQRSHETHHNYRSLQSKLEVKKFIERKGHADNDADWPNMDAMELDMRVRLADIQRQYREKQKELSRLTPKKDDKKSPGRPRKKSHSNSDYVGMPTSPAVDTTSSLQKSPSRSPDEAPPPLASTVLAMPRCNVNLVKLGEPRSHIKLLDSIPSIPIPVPPVASPITVLPTSKILQEDDEKSTTRLDYETSSPAPTICSSSSASKKRKVGRPRKLMCASGNVRHLTETIVAKKPKSKSSLVGYLLNAKNRHLQNKFISKTGYTPLPFKSGLNGAKNPKNHKSTKTKAKPAKQTPLHNKNVISSIIAEKAKLSLDAKLEKQSNKLKPKLKAEVKVKNWEEKEAPEWNNTSTEIASAETTTPELAMETPVEHVEKHIEQEKEKERHEKIKKKKRKSCSMSPKRHKSSEGDGKESKRRKSSECKECAKAAKAERAENITNKCKLTSAHLDIDQLRVLTAMGGLFYAGRLSAVQAPDVYAITLDGERGNRPHIHSREEILRDAIVEVCPGSTKEIPPGTRLCAYWSQQYRCLYPGTSVEPSEPDPELDEKFVSVEFDDGDSGRIALDDIRLLQPDYPVVEYDPNPLLSLGKRRRQTSVSTEDKRSSTGSQSGACTSTTTNITSLDANVDQQKNDEIDSKVMEEYRERKRMKKRRRDKLKRLQEAQEGKKKHRRHKCCEEHRKHKHRKHRKHKHKHNHHSSHSDGSHQSGGESCSGQKSEEEPIIMDESPKSARLDDVEEEEDKRTKELGSKEAKQEERLVVEPPQSEEKIEKPKKSDKKIKSRERQESVESRSKMAAFLPARQLWGWAGKGYRRPGAKGRAKKQFFRAIQRGSETIQIGDSAVFLSTGRPDRPYIGRIESMWETSSSNMVVKVKWFYHPEETVGCPTNLKYLGALFESPHMDENDVQTISHKCEVLPLQEYIEKLGKEPHRYLTIYDNNDIYYLAGYYDPTTYLLTMQPNVV